MSIELSGGPVRLELIRFLVEINWGQRESGEGERRLEKWRSSGTVNDRTEAILSGEPFEHRDVTQKFCNVSNREKGSSRKHFAFDD